MGAIYPNGKIVCEIESMREIIKTVLCLIVICIHLGIEMYPTAKILAKKHVATIDFKNLLNVKPLARYVSFLTEEEKNNLASILEDSMNTKSKN